MIQSCDDTSISVISRDCTFRFPQFVKIKISMLSLNCEENI